MSDELTIEECIDGAHFELDAYQHAETAEWATARASGAQAYTLLALLKMAQDDTVSVPQA